ncbi:MAG: MerR family transcriptional regulator [Opitutaceae bacterium]
MQPPPNDTHAKTPLLVRAAELSGPTPARVRRYLKIGLVRAPIDARGQPRFGATEIARLRKIRRLTNDVGLSSGSMEIVLTLLDEIDTLRIALSLPGGLSARHRWSSCRSRCGPVKTNERPSVRRNRPPSA